MGTVLPPSFYGRPTLKVAHDLIGKVLVHATSSGATAGVIVEIEAYIGESDPACHAASGLTARNAPLYGPCGRAYIYLNYGVHCLVNAVTETEGMPAAVLIRALEPREGLSIMRRRRNTRRSDNRERKLRDEHLCRGPGNLSRALGITLRQNRFDLSGGQLFIEDRAEAVVPIEWTTRVGIRVGVERRWRCYAVGSKSVSG